MGRYFNHMSLSDPGTTAHINVLDYFDHIIDRINLMPTLGAKSAATQEHKEGALAHSLYQDLLVLEQLLFPKLQENGFESSEYDLITKLKNVHDEKNSDYGDSFILSIEKFGIVAAGTRMYDKACRIETLSDAKYQQKVKTESLVDALEDLYNYSIMTRVFLANSIKMFNRDLNTIIEETNNIELPAQAKSDNYVKSDQFLESMDQVDENVTDDKNKKSSEKNETYIADTEKAPTQEEVSDVETTQVKDETSNVTVKQDGRHGEEKIFPKKKKASAFRR